MPTAAGWAALTIAFALGAAGMNSGVNVLFLISGVLFGAILVSCVGAWRQLAAVTVARRLPPSVYSSNSHFTFC